jgi:hypothetical protein
MQRRAFVLAPVLAALGSGLAHAATTPINVVSEIKSLRIPTGPYAGGYEIAPQGSLNWYFTNLGLLPIVQHLTPADLDLYIRTYLDLYLRSLNANFGIDDVHLPSGRADTSNVVKVASDSDDSYAATFLTLVARYLRASNNWTWWDANKARIKEVAYRNLAVTVKPIGLTSVFQAPRSSTNNIGYLMDNCEVYRGLRDYAALLRLRGEPVDATYYDAIATGIAGGIVKLFKSTPGAFMPGDAYLAPENKFYAGTTCQVFPQAFGVTEAAPLFNYGWNWLNKNTPSWEDGRYDPYPWAVLGFVAAKRGNTTKARTQLTMIENKFVTNRAQVTINELGFYQRARAILGSQPDI